ncbi:MAG: hypothetical protein QME12_04800 [Nanoarchaeota archaeon]|nr:hypothetical protein [Nanoarchaeota archaeon]
MDALIIGVSDRSILWRHGKIKEKDYPKLVSSYANLLASFFDNVIVTPDDGVYTDIALEFGKLKGKKPVGYYPDKDTFYGIEHIRQNFQNYEIRAIDGDWYKLNADLTKQALAVICIGFSPGVLIEGAFIKYHQKYGGFKNPKLKNIHWFIDERCIDKKLPKSFEEQIANIFYYKNLKQLKELIEKRKQLLE